MPRLSAFRASRRRLVVVGVVAAVVAAALGGVTVAAEPDGTDVLTQDETIAVPTSPGAPKQEQLDATLFVPDSATRTPAPAVLLPHGFGGSKDSVASDATELAERGFVVLTYSARGFGDSTGQIELNDPDAEVADAGHLLDYLAAQDTVATDGADDPRVAVTGSSYAGALALLLAGTDDRVDAIAPVMTYNDLEQALLPNNARHEPFTPTSAADAISGPGGVFKRAWAGSLFLGGVDDGSAGAESDGPAVGPQPDAPEPGTDSDDAEAPGATGGGGAPTGQPGPDNGTCGRFAQHVCDAYVDLAEDGTVSDRTQQLLQRVSPRSVADDISAPTLLIQGEQDTLFGLEHADATARQIHEAGGDVQLAWYAGGHDGGGPGPNLRAEMGDWLAWQLDGPDPPDENPFGGFRYDVQGSFAASGAPSVRTVEADGYPGVHGGRVPQRDVPLRGDQQTVTRPPGGAPAAISGLPGMGALSGRSAVTNRLVTDLPGQSASFTSAPMDDQVLITGSSTVRLAVTPLATSTGARDTADDVQVFVKLYAVAPDGTRSLPGQAVAPVQMSDVETGQQQEVTVSLPSIVHPVESGHRLELVVATTDQAYRNGTEPAAYRVSLADRDLAVSNVPGHNTATDAPTAQLGGIAGVLLLAAGVAGVGALRRRRERAHDRRADLSDVPLMIENLTKAYPGGLTAVDGLSFRVDGGQVLGLLGPNGAGKTTTLRMLMGLVQPTDGEIRVFGHRVRPGAEVLSRIGSFVEGAGFLPHMSGRENLRLYWASTGRPESAAHLSEALEIAGLGDAVHRKVRTYSQGMRQRLAIAQAMLGLPELLVLDEPTNGLDPPQIHQMREVLRRYAATGRTVVVSSHLLAEVEQTSTHVVVMHRGRRVADGAVGDIVASDGEATFVVDRPADAAEVLRDVDGLGSLDVDDSAVHVDLHGRSRSTAVAALVDAGIAVEQVGPRRRLEDAFLHLVDTDSGDSADDDDNGGEAESGDDDTDHDNGDDDSDDDTESAGDGDRAGGNDTDHDDSGNDAESAGDGDRAGGSAGDEAEK